MGKGSSPRSAWLFISLTGALALGPAYAAGVDVQTRSLPYQQGDTLIVQNDYGRVRLETWKSPRVEIKARRIAQDDAHLENVEVVIQRSPNKLFAHAYFYDYQAESVYFDVLAPETLNVVVWGANPAVEIVGVKGFVQVHTQTGLVTATNLTSSVSLITESGDILFRADRQPERDIRLESIRGRVRCELNGSLNFRGWTRAGGRLSWNREVELSGGQLEKQVGVGGPLLYAGSLEGDVAMDLGMTAAWDASTSRSGGSQSGPAATGSPTAGNIPRDADWPDEPSYGDDPLPPGKTENSGHPSASSDPTQTEDYRTTSDGAIDSGYSLKVDVNWTYLNVSVRDRYTNRSVPNLRQDDFLVYEDGAQQTIERFESNEAPFNLLLLLDVSGSTKSYIDLIQEASVEFTRQIKSNDSIGVAVFNSDVQLIQPFTNDRSRVERSIRRIRSGGGTAFYDALDTSIRDYMSGLEGRKAIVVFSDGVDNQLTGDWSNGSRTTFNELYRSIQEIDTIIYTIFLDTEGRSNQPSRMPRNPRRGGGTGGVIDIILGDILRGGSPGGGMGGADSDAYEEARRELQIIADQTGGRMYSPRDTGDLNHVYSEIADDLRIQYTLGYASTNGNNDGRWRSIDVRVRNAPDLAVRSRKGYYAPGGPGDRRRNP